MKHLCFIFMTFLTSQTWAQLMYQAEVREVMNPSSVTEEVKRERLFEVGLKGMEHFSSELGYDFADFKKKLETKFEDHFAALKEQKLTERFGTGKDSLSEEEKKKFLEEIDANRSVEFRKFSKVLQTIQSYNFKLPSDVTANATLIELKLDRHKLNRLFKKIISNEKKPYARLWIVSEVSLGNLAWSDLGLEKEESFLHPLSESWQKWVNENLPDAVEDVASCDPGCQKFYEQWEQKTVDQLAAGVDGEYRHSLIAKVSLSLRRTQFNATLNESVFDWDGKLLILDVDTKRTIVSYTLPLEKKSWRGLDQKELNSAVASRLYRTPLPFFKQLDGALKGNQLNRVTRLVIQGHKNISDVLALIELMKGRGSSLSLDVKLDKIRQTSAELLCFYQGEEKAFSDLLSKLKELKSRTSYQLVNEFTGTQHVLKMVSE